MRDAPALEPSSLPDTLLPEADVSLVIPIADAPTDLMPGPTFDASQLAEPQQKQFHRNLRAVEQVRTEVSRLKMELALVAIREGAKSVARPRESAESFVLSIPAPALLTQVDEHTMDLYFVTPSGETVASQVHAAVLICVKTAAILGAVLALGPLKEEDYMRLVKQCLERKGKWSPLSSQNPEQFLGGFSLSEKNRPFSRFSVVSQFELNRKR